MSIIERFSKKIAIPDGWVRGYGQKDQINDPDIDFFTRYFLNDFAQVGWWEEKKKWYAVVPSILYGIDATLGKLDNIEDAFAFADEHIKKEEELKAKIENEQLDRKYPYRKIKFSKIEKFSKKIAQIEELGFYGNGLFSDIKMNIKGYFDYDREVFVVTEAAEYPFGPIVINGVMDDYDPGMKTTGAGNPPDWDIHISRPESGYFVSNDLLPFRTFGKNPWPNEKEKEEIRLNRIYPYRKIKFSKRNLIEEYNLSPDDILQMREWVKECAGTFGDVEHGDDVDDFSDEMIVEGVDWHYDGGINGFLKAIMVPSQVKKEGQRKTIDEYQLWTNYGYGWEHEISEDTMWEARKRQKEYAENCPQCSTKIVRKRIPATSEEINKWMESNKIARDEHVKQILKRKEKRDQEKEQKLNEKYPYRKIKF